VQALKYCGGKKINKDQNLDIVIANKNEVFLFEKMEGINQLHHPQK